MNPVMIGAYSLLAASLGLCGVCAYAWYRPFRYARENRII